MLRISNGAERSEQRAHRPAGAVMELWELDASEIARAVRDEAVSPRELLAVFEDRIASIDPELHAFCTPTLDLARAQADATARKLAAGEAVGPLAGVPVAVKDLISTAGIPTVGGCRAYSAFVPEEDDIVVERVKAAGGLTLGKTNVSELGYGPVGHNPVFPTTRNPWNPERSPGGSSAGSAVAVATAMSAVALGSDGGGSVRIPAAVCGVVGVKASMGRVPLYPGCRDPRFPGFSSWESLEHIGPISRSVADAALLLSVIAGPDPRDRHSIPVADVDWVAAAADVLASDAHSSRRLRIGLSEDWGYARVDPAVRHAVGVAALVFAGDLGFEVETITAPWSDPGEIFETLVALDTDLTGMRRMIDGGAEFGPAIRAIVDRDWRAEDFTNAITQRKVVVNAMAKLMAGYDLILTPTVAAPPPGAEERAVTTIDGEPVSGRAWNAFTFVANMTGQPAVSLPAGFDAEGLPIGIQLIGRHLADAQLLRVAAAFGTARPFPKWWRQS